MQRFLKGWLCVFPSSSFILNSADSLAEVSVLSVLSPSPLSSLLSVIFEKQYVGVMFSCLSR